MLWFFSSDVLSLAEYMAPSSSVCLPLPATADPAATAVPLRFIFAQQPAVRQQLGSESGVGVGGVLWASAVVLAEHLASPAGRADLLGGATCYCRRTAICCTTLLPFGRCFNGTRRGERVSVASTMSVLDRSTAR